MTFQISLTTPDGVVIGSDRTLTNLAGCRHSNKNYPKIKINDDESFAYCSAGNSDLGDVLGEVVKEELLKGITDFTGDDINGLRVLAQCVKAAQERDADFNHAYELPTSSRVHAMLVFRQNGKIAHWNIDMLSQVPKISTTIPGNCIKAGDGNSPSVFFPHWYLDRLPNTPKTLIPLAVHTVLMAKSDYISGVQIGIFTPTIFRVLTKEELKPFIELSNSIDTQILDLFRKGEQLWSN